MLLFGDGGCCGLKGGVDEGSSMFKAEVKSSVWP